MPALYKILVVQLPQGLIREANETANSIAAPDLRDTMIGMVKADNAVTLADSTGNPQEAMALLWKSWLDHKLPPAQAKWNSPIRLFWEKKRDTLAFEWHRLARRFPDDASVRYNTGLSLLNFNEYENAATNLRAATVSQGLPESVRGQAFKNLGLALMNNGQIAEAESPLRAALEQPQPDLRAYCLLSDVYKRTARPNEAARAEASCPGRTSSDKTAQ